MKRFWIPVLVAFALAPAAALAGDKPAKTGASGKAPTAKSTDRKTSGDAKKAPPRKRPMRRAEKHSAEQTRIHRIKPVVVYGRSQLPQAVVDISRAAKRFQVGTERYSYRPHPFKNKERQRRRVRQVKTRRK